MEPVRAFAILCLSCFTPDKVTVATDGEQTIYVCSECGSSATAQNGTIPKAVYE